MTLRGPEGDVRARGFHFPVGLPARREPDVGLAAEARADGDGATLTVRARRFAQSIAVEVEGFEPDDAYFHLAPGEVRALRLRRTSSAGAPRGTLQALNAEAATKVAVAS